MHRAIKWKNWVEEWKQAKRGITKLKSSYGAISKYTRQRLIMGTVNAKTAREINEKSLSWKKRTVHRSDFKKGLGASLKNKRGCTRRKKQRGEEEN